MQLKFVSHFAPKAGTLIGVLDNEIQFRREVVADNLRRLRQALGYSLRELASLTGVSHSHILKIETGRYDFQVETLGRIAIALGVPCGLIIDAGVAPSSTAFEQAILREKFFTRDEWRRLIPTDWNARNHRAALQFASESSVLFVKLLLSTRARLTVDRVNLPPVPNLRVAWQEFAHRIDGLNIQSRWLPISDRNSMLAAVRKMPVATLNAAQVFCPDYAIAYVNQIDEGRTSWIVEDSGFQELL